MLTILRLFMAALFFFLLGLYRYGESSPHLLDIATSVFILAAITDALDGNLARRWQAESTFGRVMDPFADKILVLGAFFYLAGPHFSTVGGNVQQVSGVSGWMVVIIVARELLVTAIRGQVEALGIRFGAVRAGKLKMILQTIAIPSVLLLVAHADPLYTKWSLLTRDILVWATVVATVISGIPYITHARAALRDRPDIDGQHDSDEAEKA